MNKKYLLAGLFVASLGTTSIATAGAGDTYAGVSLGNASPDSSFFDDSVGWKIFGGYELNEILAVEGGYVSFGEMDGPTEFGATTVFEVTGFEVAAVGNYPINSQLSVFGKVGLLAWDAELSNPNIGSISDTGTDVFFGLGGQYEISGNLAVRGQLGELQPGRRRHRLFICQRGFWFLSHTGATRLAWWAPIPTTFRFRPPQY
ncbi:MAG: outer membrane beta-barrel protein [Gammaproteobacteria bacterium]|nr:outer membrane beta-barrel protein [Gammaproteobacteria bacterium]